MTFVIIDHTNKKDEVEIIRDSVVASISKIENDFHPDQVVLSGNNSVDSLIVVFQKDALTICSIWKSLDNMQEFNGTPTNSSSLLKYYRDMFHELSTYESKVFIDLMLIYATVDTNTQKTINISKIENSYFIPIIDGKDKYMSKYLDKAVRQSARNEFKAVYKTLDKMKSKKEYYIMEDEILKYILDLNISFTRILRKRNGYYS